MGRCFAVVRSCSHLECGVVSGDGFEGWIVWSKWRHAGRLGITRISFGALDFPLKHTHTHTHIKVSKHIGNVYFQVLA